MEAEEAKNFVLSLGASRVNGVNGASGATGYHED